VVKALEGLQGVNKILVSYPEKKVILSYDNSGVSIEQICEALFKIGYVAKLKTNVKTAPADISGKPFENLDYKADGLICYCFNYTKDDIEQDFIKNGRSLIMESIAGEKKAGGCDCAIKNPKGR
jgi:copper chaperone CopZ